MSDRKGFTLIEIIAVMVIIGILATIAIPNYSTMVSQGAAKAAQNNLISIYNAQKNYYFSATNGGTYYTIAPAACPDTELNINTALSLNISDTRFSYCCTNAGGFTCTASGLGVTLTLTNNPIVLPGAAGANNPSCAGGNICPS